MKDYLLLLRVNLKTMLRGMFTSGLRDDKGKMRVSMLLLYILALLGFAMMAGMVIWMETALYRTASTIGMLAGGGLEDILIGLALLLSMVMTLLFGVFHTMGAMYFNRDTVATAHLPIGQRTQMLARWTEIYVGEVLFSLAILLPMLINHGIAQGAGVLFYLRAVVTLLATPLYPLALSLLLATLLARFSSLTRHKEVWMVLGTVVMLAVVLGAEWMLLPNIPDDADSMFFVRLIMNNRELLNFLIGAFPPVLWALDAVNGSWLMLALFALTGAAAIALVIFVMGGSFQRICLLHTEHATARKRVRRTVRDSFEAATPFMAIFRREMNEVLKTPVYMLNAVLGVLMMPIMLIAMSVGMTSAEESIDVTALLAELAGSLAPTDIMLILAAVFSFMIFMCPIASTAVSREGKRLPIMRMIPVPAPTIIWAKAMVSIVIIAIGSLVMGVAAVILLGTAYLPHVIVSVLMANVLSAAVGVGNVLVDVVKPVLNWKSENEVMKQNLNTLFGMLISIAMTALVAVPVALLHAQAPWVRMAAAVALLAAEMGLSVLMVYKLGAPMLSRLEP